MVSSRDGGRPLPPPVLLSIVSLTYRCNALLIRFQIDPATTATPAPVCNNAHCIVSTDVVVTLSHNRVDAVSCVGVVNDRLPPPDSMVVNEVDGVGRFVGVEVMMPLA